MTADDRLKAALGLGPDAPPAFDILFVARVAEKIERRRFQMRLLVLALWAVAGGVVIWVLRPAVGDVMTPAVPWLAPAAALAVVAWVALRTDYSKAARRIRRVWLFGRL